MTAAWLQGTQPAALRRLGHMAAAVASRMCRWATAPAWNWVRERGWVGDLPKRVPRHRGLMQWAVAYGVCLGRVGMAEGCCGH